MNRFYGLKWGWALLLYGLLDLVCVGLGMGVPIVCILLGGVVGWYAARRVVARRIAARRIILTTAALQDLLKRTLITCAIAAAFTFLVMAALWGWMAPLLFDPSADLVQTGIPMILYEPWASLIGRLALMIVISPFLQFLMALLGAYLALLRWPPRAL
jgi:hypothetical protein